MKSQPTSSRYSTAATKPASSSCASVPVSNRARPAHRRGPHLVRPPGLGDSPAEVGEAEVRPVELVGRAQEHVCAGGLDVDRPVRPVVHRVDPGERAHTVREFGDLGHRRDRAHSIRGPRECDDARSLREQRPELVEVEHALGVDVAEPDGQIPVVRELEPGRDVRVVIEPRADDLVARVPVPCRGAREREVERRHVRAERDLVRRRVEETRPPPPAPARRARPTAATSRMARRGSRSPRAGRRRSPRSPSRVPVCPPGPSKKASGRCSAEKRARTDSTVVRTRATGTSARDEATRR